MEVSPQCLSCVCRRPQTRAGLVLTQGVHLQLLPQPDLLQAVVEVGLGAAADGGRQGEDAHDLPLVSACQVTREGSKGETMRGAQGPDSIYLKFTPIIKMDIKFKFITFEGLYECRICQMTPKNMCIHKEMPYEVRPFPCYKGNTKIRNFPMEYDVNCNILRSAEQQPVLTSGRTSAGRS